MTTACLGLTTVLRFGGRNCQLLPQITLARLTKVANTKLHQTQLEGFIMSNLDFTESQYHQEIKDLAYDLYDEALEQNDNDHELAMEEIIDYKLHELVDGHQWVIYTYSNELVARFSDNAEAYLECYDNESIGQIVTDKGLDGMKPIIAYFAMERDILEEIYELEAVKAVA